MAVATHVFQQLETSGPELTISEPLLIPARHTTRARWAVPTFLCVYDAAALVAALLLTGTSGSALGVAYAALAIATIAASDGYRSRITLSALQATPWLVARLAIPLLLLAPVAVASAADPSLFALVMAA